MRHSQVALNSAVLVPSLIPLFTKRKLHTCIHSEQNAQAFVTQFKHVYLVTYDFQLEKQH